MSVDPSSAPTRHAGSTPVLREACAQAAAALGDLIGAPHGQRPPHCSAKLDGSRLTVTLSEVLSPHEMTLIATGRGRLVEDVRTAFQAVMAPALRSEVERLCGERVLSQAALFLLEANRWRLTFVLAPKRGSRAAANGGPA